MSEQPTNFYSGIGTPTVPTDRPADIPPPPAAAPLVAPTLPSLSTPSPGPSLAPAPPLVPAPSLAPATLLVPPPPLASAPLVPLGAVPTLGAAPTLPQLGDPLAGVPVLTPESLSAEPPVALSPAVSSPAESASQPAFIPTLPGTDPVPPTMPTNSALMTEPALTEPALTAPPSETISPEPTPGMIDAPMLPPAGVPTPAASSEHSAPALNDLGLPADAPADLPREIPEWKRRQNSKGRKVAKRLIQLAVLGALGAGGWFVYQTQLATQDDADVTTPDTAGNGQLEVFEATRDTVAAINDNAGEDELIAELLPVASGPFEPNPDAVIASGDLVRDGFVSALEAQSWTSVWTFPDDTMTMAVNVSTGDFDATFTSLSDVRFVGGQFFESLDDGDTWNAVPPGPRQLTVAQFATSLPTFENALPTEIRDFVILSESDDTGAGQFLIDDGALFETNPEARTAWLTAWGVDPSIAPSAIIGFADTMPAVAGPGQILVSIVGSPDGIGTRLTVSTPTAGSTSGYSLIDVSASPRTIATPQVD